MIRWPDLAALGRKFRAARPFRHVVVDGLLSGADHARMQAEFGGEPLVPVEGEIYAQLRGPEPPLQPSLRALVEALGSSCAAVSEICGVPVSHADGAAYAYREDHYLLPHSDSRQHLGRALAYAYYISSPERGGELELFACTARSGRIVRTRPAKRIAPRPNRLVLFEVDDLALHQIREVLAGERTSIAGWFHR